MTIRTRLVLAFLAVVLLPIIIASAVVLARVPGMFRAQTSDRLESARAGVAAVVAQLCREAQTAAALLARTAVQSGPASAVHDVTGRDMASYAAVLGPTGAVQAEAGRRPTLAAGVAAAPGQLGSCTHPVTGGVADAETATVALRTTTGADRGSAAVAVALNLGALQALAGGNDADVTLVASGRVIASTLDLRDAAAVAAAAPGAAQAATPVSADGYLVTAAPTIAGGLLVVVTAPVPGLGGVAWVVAGVLLAALVIAAGVAWLLARATTRPLVELADAAGRLAAGDLHTRVEAPTSDEVGRVARAFNDMTDRLRAHIAALVTSRDELRRNLERLGDTLSGTHDLGRILTVILETAVATTNAGAGGVFLVSPDRRELCLQAARGLELRGSSEGLRLRLGEGVVGRVAVRGEPVLGRTAGPGALEQSATEPAARALIVVPLRSSGQVSGVLALYDPRDGGEFDAGDLATIRSFATHAAVAIDNVRLHEEAQRLSVTDPLTGLWNHRYFQQALAREIERAHRFGRSLGVLMLDLDHFKQVNDTYGHQRGDAVLVELAERVRGVVREVDVVGRYGGEELVVVLPETDVAGAAHTAERICEAVRAVPFGGEPPVTVTVSIGVAVLPRDGAKASELIGRADNALYDAKRRGRDQWRVAGQELGSVP